MADQDWNPWKIVGGGSEARKNAAIGGILRAGVAALYGVNENRKTSCMRSRGYTG